MEKLIGKLANTKLEIALDLNKYKIRGMTSWEQKYGWRQDVCFAPTECGVYATTNLVEAFRRARNPAEVYFELDGKVFTWDSEKQCFVLNAVINNDLPRYKVYYSIGDVYGYTLHATYQEAIAKYRKMYAYKMTLMDNTVVDDALEDIEDILFI